MKKHSKRLEIQILRNRYNRELRHIRKKKRYQGARSTYHKIVNDRKFYEKRLINNWKFELDDFIGRVGTKNSANIDGKFDIPKTFSLEDNFEDSIESISQIKDYLTVNLGHDVDIDFTKCERADFAALFYLRVILDEYLLRLRKLQWNLRLFKVYPRVRIIHSKIKAVNLKLVANNMIPPNLIGEVDKNEFLPISSLNMISGSKNRNHYRENMKGTATTKLRNYIFEECLKRNKSSIDDSIYGPFDGMLSEILNNAEDHSLFEKWFVFGNMFKKNDDATDPEKYGELNLAILNFGDSIFDGFESTKEANHIVYDAMSGQCEKIMSYSKGKIFTKENLFTLYALQDNVSRLRYLEESRGTGTMKFIKSFIELSNYEDKEKGIVPRLLIYSGQTCIKCDKTYMPYEFNNQYCLSLNEEKLLSLPPENSHLKNLNTRFPGTLLVVKIYFSEEQLKMAQ